MKQLITPIAIFLFGSIASAQSKVCYSLEEAKKAPRQVKELHLTNSPLTVIDTNFNQFTALEILDLSYNPILEVSEGVSIPSLKELNLAHASYNPWKIGSIGKAFPNLEHLNLSSNQLSFIWSGLQSLYNLTRLDISDNNLIDIPVEMMYLSNLRELNVSKNEIKLQANELGALWSLEKLDISDNSGLSTNNLILSIAESKHLKNLAIDGDELTSKSIQMLSNMNLERLELSDVRKPVGINFTRFTGIRKVALTHSPNWLSPETTAEFDNVPEIELTASSIAPGLDKLKSLSVLVLNDIDEAQIPKLYPLKKLQVLDVSKTSFTKEHIATLKQELPTTRIITGNAEEVTANMLANKVEPIIQIPAKSVTIQSDVACTISEKNVSLAIPENAFLDSEGKPYKGKVNVELTVYDDAIQTALAGIPMAFTDNNQQELFASNGMLKFEAKGENNETLQPNPANLIQASVGNLQPQNPGGLYAFNAQNSQWNTISTTVNTSNTNARLQRAIDSINRLDLKNLIPRVYNDRIFALYPKFSRWDRTEISLFSQFIPAQPNGMAVTHNRSNAMGKLMTKQQWVIDTIVSKEMKKQLKVMKKETNAWHHKKFRSRDSKKFIPRLINRLTIEPDPGHDNYRLNFRYRDSLVSLPVALAGNSNKQIQRNTQKFHSGVKQAKTADKKEEQKYQNSLEEQVKLAENSLRERLITIETARINNPQAGNNWLVNPNQLNFGLTNFGLINCDFFQRNKPDYSIFAANKLKDQNGNAHKVPETVISIDPAMNFYMETASIHGIRCFKSTILVFNLGEKKIGISKPQKGESTVSDIFLIDITDKSPAEISQAILSI
ncbi:leucine-rich repeat domain-containing protein [Fluviicola chungangensis]|uniref:Leucine-rich repeat domain-containing protein n=1 Tax=Fluviicola chungangensis TaxID=2597671 RepID=A0A556MRD0_9FLAO|nr:leucine-rich repeat domain-containing protein [Fluviicola chungangensis]TSJ42445.1 leucine-rich repeat domain-containing protein [Fluviicola chungangensis]